MLTFRKLALVAAIAAAAGSQDVQAASNLFILPQAGQTGQVSIYNANPLSLATTITTVPDAVFAFVNPAGSRAYIIGRSGTVAVLNASAGFAEVARYSLAAQVTAATLTPDGRKLLVLAGAVRPVDLSTDLPTNIPEINVGPLPNDMAVSLDSTRAYVTSASGRTVTLVDLTNNQAGASQQFPGVPGGVTVGPNGLVYVATSGALYEIDGRQGINLTVPGGFTFTGDPGKPVMTPDGTRVVMLTTSQGAPSSAIVVNVNSRTVTTRQAAVPLRNLVVPSPTRAFAVSDGGVVFGIPLDPLQTPAPAGNNALPGTVSIAVSDESPAATYLFGQTVNNVYRIELAGNAFAGPQSTIDRAQSIQFVTTPSANAVNSLQQTMLRIPVQPAAVSFPISVRAVDGGGRPVADAQIQYTSSESGVVFEAPSARTNLNGLAAVRATMPTAPGTYTIRAAGPSGSTIDIPIEVRTTQPIDDAQFAIAAGQGQVVTGGAVVGFQVRLRDEAGNPIQGATVNWAITSGLGFSPPTATTTTNNEGIAFGSISTPSLTAQPSSAEWNGQFRPFTVQASVADAVTASVEFFGVALASGVDLNTALVSNLQITGTEFQLPAGATIDNALRANIVTVPPAGLTPLNVQNVGIRVTTADTTTPLVRCAGNPVSSASGVAVCNLAVGTTTGAGTMDVNVGERGVIRQFPIRVIPGAPSSITVVQGDGQSGSDGQTTPRALVVEVKDVSGNTLRDVQIAWAITAGSGTLINPRDRTDNTGRASTQVQFGPAPGPVTVQATTGSLQATFTLTNTTVAGTLALAAGSPQSAPINAVFPTPLTVRLTNAAGQPVAGTTINFAVTSGPVTLSAPTAATNNAGEASVTATAGAATGPAVVTASLGATTVTFNLTVTTATPRIDALLNGASFLDGGSPCSVGVLRGANFAPSLNGLLSATLGPVAVLPLTLGGVTVQFNGIGAPIFYVSNVSGVEQVAIQIPCELQPGPVTVSINSPVGTTNREFTLTDVAPGVFETEFTQGVRQGVVIRPNGTYVSPTNPTVRGETVTGFFTGLGPIAGRITNAPGTGQTLQTENVIVGVNNSGMPVVSASYAPNLIGVYVVRFQIIESAGAGSAQPYAIAIRNAQGQTIFGQGSTLPVAAQ